MRAILSAAVLWGCTVPSGCDATTPVAPLAPPASSVDAGARAPSSGADAGHAHDAGRHEASMPDARRPIADGAGLVDALHVPDAFPDVAVIVDPDNCVAPGTASNAVGVGGYCSPGGGQCDHVGKDGGPSICTADFSAPAHAWFCTVDCATNGDCGAGTASCVPAAGGMVCVPEGCGAFEADAAADAASDAAADARDAAPRDGSGGE